MGDTTPNMGIYIPAAGETNYDSSFAAGMVNIDQHDHTGGPTGGVAIPSEGIADGSITFPKLNANVADTTTGIGTAVGPNANKLILLGLLASIYGIATPAGFIAKNGSAATARTLTQTLNQVLITHPDGSTGNPQFSLPLKDTFVPVLKFGGSSVGITYVVSTGQVAKYWRVGPVIFFSINIFLTNKGAQTGSATIDGLPVASANDGFVGAAFTQAFLNTFNGVGAGGTYVSAQINPNSTDIQLAGCGPGIQTDLTDNDFTNASELSISGFYWTV